MYLEIFDEVSFHATPCNSHGMALLYNTLHHIIFESGRMSMVYNTLLSCHF